MSGFGRIALAIFVVVVASSLLNTNVPNLNADMSNFEEFRFWLAIKSAISYFFAAGLGAIVARRTFVVPALALAVVGWVLTISIIHEIASAAGPSSYLKIAADNWMGFMLLVIAATTGAIAGRWFYRHEIENVAAAA